MTTQTPLLTTRRRALSAILGGTVAAAAFGVVACTPRTDVTVAGPAQQTGITVTGTANVQVQPDVARVNLGVEVSDATVEAARNRAATALTQVQEALKRQGVQDKDIQTISLNISPQYANQTPDRASPPRITGYRVTNIVQVTVRDIDKTSAIVDGAAAAGGDSVRVNGISFTVDQPEQFLAQARDEAVKNARARAETLAKAAGVTLGPARSISESGDGGPVPFAERAFAPAAAGGASTPVNPGEQTLSLTVTVTYNIESGS